MVERGTGQEAGRANDRKDIYIMLRITQDTHPTYEHAIQHKHKALVLARNSVHVRPRKKAIQDTQTHPRPPTEDAQKKAKATE